MTQYLISVSHDTAEAPTMATMSPEEIQPIYEAVSKFNEKLMANGQWVFGGGLEPPTATTGVDNTGVDVVVTDGPYVESKEYMGGFWVIEAPDLDAALKLAAEGSKACGGRVEVRPFQSE